MAKYLNVGCVTENTLKDGNTIQRIELDNEKLDELIKLLDKHFVDNVEGLSVDDIRKAQKLRFNDPNKLKKVQFYLFDPSENAPSFIKKNIAVKLDEF